MPISSQVTNAYVPRVYPELDENGICETQRTVNDVTVDVQHLASAPTQSVSSSAKVLIIIGIVVGICIAAAAIVTLSVLLTRTTTTTSTTSTSTATTTTTTTTSTSTTSVTTTTASIAPSNMVGYRGNINQNYTFTVTGSSSGGIWGTTIYTDDTVIAVAAVHRGLVTIGQTVTVIIMVIAGQSSYTSSTQNGITSSSYGSWAGSYQFVISSG